jgi:hypothetical protein
MVYGTILGKNANWPSKARETICSATIKAVLNRTIPITKVLTTYRQEIKTRVRIIKNRKTKTLAIPTMTSSHVGTVAKRDTHRLSVEQELERTNP